MLAWLSRRVASGWFVPDRWRAAAFQQRADGLHQRRSARAQFTDAILRYLFEQFFSARQQRHQDLPAVVPVSAPAHVAVSLQPVDQLHGAMMLQRQPVRQRANRRFLTLRESAKSQQEQIRWRLEPRGSPPRAPSPHNLAKAVAPPPNRAVLVRCISARHALSVS